MPVPESSLGWLGTLLHELGHAYSDQNKENAMVSARKFNGYMEILERNEEKLQQNSFDIVLNQKNEFIGAWRVVLGVCREKGTIPQNEADMIESVLESISDGAQYVWDNWGSLKKIYFGSDSVSNAWDYLLCRRHGPKGKYLFKKLGNIVNAVSERSATAYALHAIRRIDRELGTDISHAVFRSTKRYGKVLEGTVHAYLSEALSTYGAHRGEGGIAPGTPLPRFSDFDVPPPKRG